MISPYTTFDNSSQSEDLWAQVACASFATKQWAYGKPPLLPLELEFYANSRHDRSIT